MALGPGYPIKENLYGVEFGWSDEAIASRDRSLKYNQGEESYCRRWEVVPQFVISPTGGLTHIVVAVVEEYAHRSYGLHQTWKLLCGQQRTTKNCQVVIAPDFICHLCHDKHWLYTGEHLSAFPQTGCEVTQGSAYVSERVRNVRVKALGSRST